MGSSLRSGRNCRWEEWMNSALSTLNTTTEVPLSKAPNPQLLPGRHSPLLRVCVHGVCVCSLLCVCTWIGINAEHKFRVCITILGHTSRHFHFYFNLFDDWLLYWWCTQINTIYNNNNSTHGSEEFVAYWLALECSVYLHLHTVWCKQEKDALLKNYILYC